MGASGADEGVEGLVAEVEGLVTGVDEVCWCFINNQSSQQCL